MELAEVRKHISRATIISACTMLESLNEMFNEDDVQSHPDMKDVKKAFDMFYTSLSLVATKWKDEYFQAYDREDS